MIDKFELRLRLLSLFNITTCSLFTNEQYFNT